MDTLTPPLVTAIQSLRWMIASGRSPREALRIYLAENSDDLAETYRDAWLRTNAPAAARPTIKGVYRRALWRLLERGMAGEPILSALSSLEDEVLKSAAAELDMHLTVLPFKMLIPLLGFQFPAHLLLLLGPALGDLNRHLGAG